MKIEVLMETDERRMIDVDGPVRVIKGEKLDRLVSSDGVEHWFTKTGRYDGCGVAMNCQSVNGNE